MLTVSSINKFVISYANSVINCFTVRHMMMDSCGSFVGVSSTQQFLLLQLSYTSSSIVIIHAHCHILYETLTANQEPID